MKIYNQLVSIFGMSFVAAGLLFGGCNDDDKLEGVDLRYEDVGELTMKDQYTITADGKNTVDFRVNPTIRGKYMVRRIGTQFLLLKDQLMKWLS